MIERKFVPVNTTSTAEDDGKPVTLLTVDSFTPYQLNRMALLSRTLQLQGYLLRLSKGRRLEDIYLMDTETHSTPVGKTKASDFIRGVGRLTLGLWKDLAYPSEQMQGHMVETEDEIGKLIAEEIVNQNRYDRR